MKLSKDLGLMLYLAEGDKTGNYFVALTNTDWRVLNYFVCWLRKYFDIDEKKLRCRLYIWNSLNEIDAKRFWSKKLAIPLDQFTKSYFSNSKPKIRKNRHEYGVCRVSYGSVSLFSSIMKGISKILD